MMGSYRLRQALIVSVLYCTTALMAPVYAQQQNAALEPLKMRVEGRLKAGTKRSILETKIWAPIQQDYTSVTYADIRFSGDNNDNFEGNVGAGYRWLFDNETMLGGNVWFDRRRTERDAFFNQFTFGGEVIKKNYDLRMNAYVPVSGAQMHNTPVIGKNTTPYLADTGIYYDGLGQLVEKPQYGFDIEAGYQLPFLQDHVDSFRVYAGMYDFRANNTQATTGGLIRAAVDIMPHINVGTRFQYDGSRGSQAFAEMTIRFPFDAKRSFRQHGLSARMDESPARDIDIVIAARQVSDGIAKPVLNSQTGQMQRVIYVDNSNTEVGDGTLDNPFQNLKAAEAELRAHDVLYIFEGTGDSTHMDRGLVIAHQGVSVIGSGVDFTWQNGKFKASDAGSTSTPLIKATNNPIITNTDFFDVSIASGLTGGGIGNGVLSTGRNTFLSGFTVDGTNGNGILILAEGSGVNLGNIVIDSVSSVNQLRRGISIQAANGGVIDDVVIRNNLTENTGFRGIEVMVRGSDNSHVGNINILDNRVINNTGGAHSINIQPGGINNSGINFANSIKNVRIAGNLIETAPTTSTGIASVFAAGGVIDTMVIENNHFAQIGVGASSNISLVMNNGYASSVLVRDNIIETSRQNGMIISVAQDFSSNILIEGNTFVSNNTTSNATAAGISLTNASTGNVVFDLGGGVLGSTGGNRIFNNNVADIRLNIGNAVLSAQGNWWGDAAGLNPARVALIGNSTIDSGNWLVVDPGP